MEAFCLQSASQTGSSLLCKPDGHNQISLHIDMKSQIILGEKQRETGDKSCVCVWVYFMPQGCARFN